MGGRLGPPTTLGPHPLDPGVGRILEFSGANLVCKTKNSIMCLQQPAQVRLVIIDPVVVAYGTESWGGAEEKGSRVLAIKLLRKFLSSSV